MKLIERKSAGRVRVTQGLLAVLGLIGVAIFIRELPALRRYLRMERM
jgi:hypothetical protein